VVVVFALCISSLSSAANVFSGDADCRAVWRLESGALATDATGHGNTLTNTGVTASATCQEGSGSGDWELSDSDYMLISDASLSSGFPLKTGDVDKDISVCFWCRMESLVTAYCVSKADFGSSKISFGVLVTSAGKFGHLTGYNSGASYEASWATNTVTAGRWYHVGATYNGSTQAYTLRVWDDTASAVVANLSGTKTNGISVTDASVVLGSRDEGADGLFDGLIDEVAVFSRVLSTTEIDNIRNGIFGAGSGSPGSRRIILAQ